MSSVGGTHSSSTADISGSTDEAGTMYCKVDDTGATVAPSTIKSTGQSTAVSSAGSFTMSVTVADVTDKSVFCVGEDGVGNLGSTATGEFGTPPSDISLNATTVAENAAAGTEVGTLSTTDVDDGDTFTYSITAQGVSAAFQINGDKVEVGTGVLDFEATPTVSVTVRSTDSGGLTFDKAFTVTLTDVNEAPTGIVFTATTVDSQANAGTLVGSLSTVDEDTDDSFTYTIVAAPSNVFYVAGSQVLVGTEFADLSPGHVVTMNVTTTDEGGLALTRSVSTVVVRINSLWPLAIVTGIGAVAAAFAAAFYVKSTSTAATTASSTPV